MNGSESVIENILQVERTSEVPQKIECNTDTKNSTSKSNTYNVEKSSVVWTYNATLKLLNLYKNNLEMLEKPKKKTRIWLAISKCLKDYNIEMTPNQVRWKINALTKKYKQCFDKGQPRKFKYFRELDNIYAKYNVDCDSFELEEFLHNKKKTCLVDASNRTLQISESKAIIDLRKLRLANRIESDRSLSKLNLEKQWLDYLNKKEQDSLQKNDIFDRSLKIKEEELELLRCKIEMEKSFELRKLQLKEKNQNELISFEIQKCEMFNQILANKIKE